MWAELRAYGRISRMNFRMQYGWMQPWVYGLTLIIRPAAQVIFFGVMARFVTGQADVSFQLIGNAIQVCALASLYTVADALVTERQNGTLALVAMAPRRPFFLFAGRVWLLGLHGLLITGAALAIGAAGFGLELGQTRWGALGLALTVTVLATSALGTALGSLGLVTSDINLAGNVAAALLLALCGINFPVAALPAWLQPLSYGLPMTRGAAAARLAVAGGGPGLAGLVAGEALVGLAWLGAGYAVFRWAERRARRDGALDLY